MGHGRTGRDHDVLGLEALARDVDRAFSGQGRRAAQDGHAARFEEPLDAFDQPVHDARLSFQGGGPIDADLVRDHAELAAGFSQRVQLGGLQQRLGRDASAHQARAADPVALDQRGPGAQLGRAEGGHVAAGPAPDHEDIE